MLRVSTLLSYVLVHVFETRHNCLVCSNVNIILWLQPNYLRYWNNYCISFSYRLCCKIIINWELHYVLVKQTVLELFPFHMGVEINKKVVLFNVVVTIFESISPVPDCDNQLLPPFLNSKHIVNLLLDFVYFTTYIKQGMRGMYKNINRTTHM